jgi:hypothetical protein
MNHKVFIVFFIWMIIGCEKDPEIPPTTQPVVSSTFPASSITSNSAKSGGIIQSNGGLVILERGICWSTSANPTINSTRIISIGGLGSFNVDITGLSQGMTYFVRAYAINEIGTSYGNQISFNTQGLPTVTTTATSNIAATSAISGGNISNGGGSGITARGVCWSTSTNPTTALATKTSNGSGTGSFSSSITGLTPGTIYFVRAYATNSVGTSYGNQNSFTTLSTTPTITTNTISSITTNTAISGGNISNDGGATITVRGVCWSSSTTSPTIALSTKTANGSGTGNFSSNITGLLTRTTYYVRAYATNSVGTSYGQTISFTTF